MNTLQTLLADACHRLEKSGVETPRLDAEVLISHALGISREEFWRDAHRHLHPDEITFCEQLVQRREIREPLAYIIGEREFWSRSFKVTPDVLIPRPETEILIEQLLKSLSKEERDEPLRGLDMCTGSGVLAIISALELPVSNMVGIDISSDALNIARENSQCHGVEDRITWMQSDMFGSLQEEKIETGRFDFILCNPPYIATEECQTLQPEISRFEPVGALDGGPDGLRFFDEIFEGASTWLKPGGYLLMEIGSNQGESVKTLLMKDTKFCQIVLHQDYSGRDRAVSARKGTDG